MQSNSIRGGPLNCKCRLWIPHYGYAFIQKELISIYLLCFTDEVVQVGCMVINSVAQLRPLIQSNVYSLPNAPTLADLDFDDDLEGEIFFHL